MTDRWAEWGSDSSVTFGAPRADRCYVYVAWGEDRTRPLYIGKARKPWARFLFHMRETEWAASVVEWECYGFVDDDHAEWAETEAIHELKPIHNRLIRQNQAYWDEVHRQSALEERRKAEKRRQQQKAEIQRRERQAKKPSEPPVVSPHRHKRLRVQRWDDELFTSDQLEIIARVQGRRP